VLGEPVDRPGQARSRGRGFLGWLWQPRPLLGLALGFGALGSWMLVAQLASAPAAEGAGEPSARARAPAVSAVEASRDLDALALALTSPYHEASASLGAHRVRDRAAVRLRPLDEDDGAEEELKVDTEITLVSPEELRARLDSSAGYARDLVITGGDIYARPGYGPFHRRPPERPEEIRELLDELASGLGAYLAPLLPGAAISGTRQVEVHGRRAIAIELATGGGRTRVDPRSWGADRAVVRGIRGELLLDAETALPLGGEVSGELELSRDGRRLELFLAVGRELDGVGEALALDVPAGDDVIVLVDATEAPAPPPVSQPAPAREDEPWNEP
jgi:hypothetical protein